MSISDFLKQKQNQSKNKSKKSNNKSHFRHKILDVLEQIKVHSEEKHQELSTIFKKRYDKMNTQKKILLGFYAQVVQELKTLRQEGQVQVQNVIKEVKQAEDKVIKTTKKVANNIKKAAEKTTKKVTKKETKKKKAKKTAKKVTKKSAKKKTTKKVTKKKAAKKVTKKKTKKTKK